MSQTKRIEPRTLKGFRDYLPEAMIPRERLIETARRVYRSYGFSPIDTPALEYLEVLAGKGGEETDKAKLVTALSNAAGAEAAVSTYVDADGNEVPNYFMILFDNVNFRDHLI